MKKMRKSAKKISLRKDTLRDLETQDLKAGGGAQWTFSCYSICECPSTQYTFSCGCE
jgi:hypothetical protein